MREFKVVSVPLLDTGIGKSQGYADDQEFMAAMDAERAALPAEQRKLMDELDAKIDARMLGSHPSQQMEGPDA